MLSEAAYYDLKTAKRENYDLIYRNPSVNTQYEEIIRPMFVEMYEILLRDVKSKQNDSMIYKHHIDYLVNSVKYYENSRHYADEEPNQIVVDYIASMTDDYFIALHKRLVPNSKYQIVYQSYFE